MYRHKSLKKYSMKTVCDWLADDKLSINFGDHETKSILLTIKQRAKNIHKLNIRYKEINKKEQVQVTYLGWVLNELMSVESMALKIINKITQELRRLPCNTLIQPHFDYS